MAAGNLPQRFALELARGDEPASLARRLPGQALPEIDDAVPRRILARDHGDPGLGAEGRRGRLESPPGTLRQERRDIWHPFALLARAG